MGDKRRCMYKSTKKRCSRPLHSSTQPPIAKKEKKANKTSALRKGMLFFEATHKTCNTLFEKSENTILSLNDYWVEESTKNNDQKSEERLFLSKWLATTLAEHQEKLKAIVSNEVEKITTIPTLIKGFVKEIGDDTDTISCLLKQLENAVKTNQDEEIIKEKLKKEIVRKQKLADFFEEEVQERSAEFSEGLSKYITHYCVLNHLLDCSGDLLSLDKKRITNLEKKIRSIKNPLL